MAKQKMEKLKMHSPNLTNANIENIKKLFPNCIVESKDENSKLKLAVDFDLLKQELCESIVEGQEERYQINWPGKRQSVLAANTPIAKTLRPAPDESVDFDTTKNLFIEGDNLDALKLLQNTYLGKVKMIYIDPPYNTGNDFIYEDNFTQNSKDFLLKSNQIDIEGNRLVANKESNGRFHSDWLSMIYPRLKLAKNLLKDDGVIFVSADENEAFNLKKILDEVFGSENCVNDIVWKNRYNAAKEKHLAKIHEYIFVYAKSISRIDAIYLPPTEDYINRYFKNKDDAFEMRGPFRLQPLEAGKSMDARPNLTFAVPAPDGTMILPKRQWKWGKDRILTSIAKNELEFAKIKGVWSVSTKQYLKDEAGKFLGVKPFSLIENIFSQTGTKEICNLFGSVSFFSFPKPTLLLKHLIQIGGCEDGDIILDFFAGSSTTAHAVMQLNAQDGGNRQFIMVQLPEKCDEKSEAFKAGYKNIAEIGKERIRRAGKKILEQYCASHEQSLIADNKGWNKDIGFRVLKVDSSNMKDVYYTPATLKQSDLLDLIENIKPDRTPEDLLFQVLLDLGVDLSLPIVKKIIGNKAVFFVDGDTLAACFDGGIDEELVKKIAKTRPAQAVFRDNGFEDDSTKINTVEIFKQLSFGTQVSVI